MIDKNGKNLKVIEVPLQNISVRKAEYPDFLRAKVKFDYVLSQLIPILDTFEFLSGKEGRAYFVDDDYVVKKVKMPTVSLENFNNYCKEIKNFGDSGLAVPKIYTWQSIENGEDMCDTYILQERIKGQRLFESDIMNIFDRCKHFCTKEEFLEAIKNKNQNRELFGMILKTYLEGFLKSNKKLLEISDKSIEHFIMSDFQMTLKSKYGYTDIHSENVILSDKAVTIIDNFFEKNTTPKDNESVRVRVLKDVMLMFCYNEMAKKYLDFDCGLLPEFKRISEENLEICAQAMKRMIKKTNQIYDPQIKNPVDYFACEKYLKGVLNNKLAKKVSKEIQRDFW